MGRMDKLTLLGAVISVFYYPIKVALSDFELEPGMLGAHHYAHQRCTIHLLPDYYWTTI